MASGRTLGILGVVGLGIAAYAVYTLRRPRERPEPVASEVGDERAPRASTRPTPQPASERTMRPASPEAPSAQAPAGVEDRPSAPEGPSAEAQRLRGELAALLSRLDEEIQRGRVLPRDEWVEVYTKANSDISNLAREIGSDPDAAEEIAEYHKGIRKRLGELQAPPEEPPEESPL